MKITEMNNLFWGKKYLVTLSVFKVRQSDQVWESLVGVYFW